MPAHSGAPVLPMPGRARFQCAAGQAEIVPFLFRHGVADQDLEADDALAILGHFASEFQPVPRLPKGSTFGGDRAPRSLSTAPIP